MFERLNARAVKCSYDDKIVRRKAISLRSSEHARPQTGADVISCWQGVAPCMACRCVGGDPIYSEQDTKIQYYKHGVSDEKGFVHFHRGS